MPIDWIAGIVIMSLGLWFVFRPATTARIYRWGERHDAKRRP